MVTDQAQQGICFRIAFQNYHSPGGQSYDTGWGFLQPDFIFILLYKPAE